MPKNDQNGQSDLETAQLLTLELQDALDKQTARADRAEADLRDAKLTHADAINQAERDAAKQRDLALEHQKQAFDQALVDARQRASDAEARARDLEHDLAEADLRAKGQDPEADHVMVQKGEEVLHIHPSAVASHRQAGWKLV